MATIDQLIAKQRSYIGYHEGPNNDTIFGTWIGAPNAAWCDSFQHQTAYSLGFRFPGSQFPDKGDASVGYTIAWHKSRGMWTSRPTKGAMVTYDWGGKGNWLEYHIELVIAVLDSTHNLVIGGNVGDSVVEQTRSHFAVTGYCLLPYQAAHIPPPIVAPKPVPNMPLEDYSDMACLVKTINPDRIAISDGQFKRLVTVQTANDFRMRGIVKNQDAAVLSPAEFDALVEVRNL